MAKLAQLAAPTEDVAVAEHTATHVREPAGTARRCGFAPCNRLGAPWVSHLHEVRALRLASMGQAHL